MEQIIIAFGILVAIIVVLAIFFSFFPLGLWISAMASGVKIKIFTLVGMRIRRITPSRLVYPLIKATKAGLDISINKMEAHYLAGGNVDRVINALIAAQRADIDLVFERAAAIDLAGRDVLQAVQMSVNPKVIETPVVAAIAKDRHRPRRRGHRHHRRLRREPQAGARKPGHDLPHGPGQGPGRRHRL